MEKKVKIFIFEMFPFELFSQLTIKIKIGGETFLRKGLYLGK